MFVACFPNSCAEETFVRPCKVFWFVVVVASSFVIIPLSHHYLGE